MTADQVLRRLAEAEASITRLAEHESPAAQEEALRATWHAAEQALRALLRDAPGASDDLRMAASSPAGVPAESLLRETRRLDLIPLPLAGAIHELRNALAPNSRIPPAGAAELARNVTRELRSELAARTRRPRSTERPDGRPDDGPAAGSARVAAAASQEIDAGPDADSRGPRRPLYIAGAAAGLLVIAAVLVVMLGRGSALERGIDAFEAGDMDAAEQQFRIAIEADQAAVSARLYLARILRGQQRRQEAADQLREAVRYAPSDAAVRRELGYLFLDLGQPEPASGQFELAVELEPEQALNWVGMVLALRRAGDPAAEAWLRRAPAEARRLLESRGG